MEEEEEYIDLQDIEILDEELDGDYNPSDEEILAYAEYLGFDLERDQELLVVAYQALKTPLPENWKRAVLKNSQEVLYINLEDQTLHTYSPIDEAAILHYREQKEIMNKKSNSIQPATKVIPRAKNLPPIEKGEKTEKNKKSKLDKLNLAPNFSPEKNTMTNDLNTDLKNKDALLENQDLANLENLLNEKNHKKKKKNEQNRNKNKPINDMTIQNVAVDEEKLSKPENNKKDLLPDKKQYGDGITNPSYDYSNIKIGSNFNTNFPIYKSDSLYNIPTKLDKNINDQKNKPDDNDNQDNYINNANNLFKAYENKEPNSSTRETHNTRRSKKEKQEKDLDEELMKQFSGQNTNNIKDTNRTDKNTFDHISINDNNDNDNLLNDSYTIIRSKDKKLKFDSPPNENNLEKEINKQNKINTNNDEARKTEYLDFKMSELKKYEENLRKNYESQKKNFRSKRRSTKEKITEEYNKKFDIYKQNKREELEKFLNLEKENLEKIYAEKIKNFETSYKLSSVSEEEELSVECLKLEKKISELEIIKNKLEKELEAHQKELLNIKTYKKDNPELNMALQVISEKHEIERKALERKYDNSLKDFEIEQNKILQAEKDDLKKRVAKDKEELEKQIKNSNLKILEEFKKALNEDYKTRINEINLEEQKVFNNNIETLEKEKQKLYEEKMINYKQESRDLEKSYYSELNNIRISRKNNKLAHETSTINLINLGNDEESILLKELINKNIKLKSENIINIYQNIKGQIKEKIGEHLSLLLSFNSNKNLNNDSKIDNTHLLIESSTDNFKNNKFNNINYNFSNSNVSYIKEADIPNKIEEINNLHEVFENEFENRLDEYLANILDNTVTQYLHKKNNYETIEKEKLDKMRILEYYLNLSYEVIKFFSEHPIGNVNIENSVLEYNETNMDISCKFILKKSQEIKSLLQNKYYPERNLQFKIFYNLCVNFDFTNLDIFSKLSLTKQTTNSAGKALEILSSQELENRISNREKNFDQNNNNFNLLNLSFQNNKAYNSLKNNNNNQIYENSFIFSKSHQFTGINLTNSPFIRSNLNFANEKNFDKNHDHLRNSSQIDNINRLINFNNDMAKMTYRQDSKFNNKNYNETNVPEKLKENENNTKINLVNNPNVIQSIILNQNFSFFEKHIQDNLSFFSSFINSELERFNIIFSEITSDKIIFDNLKNAIETKYNQEKYSNLKFYEQINGIEPSSNRRSYRYNDLIEEEKNKINKKETFIKNTKKLFDKVYDLIVELSSFVNENSNSFEDHKRNVNNVNQKILNIKNQISEYYKFIKLQINGNYISLMDEENIFSSIISQDKFTNFSNSNKFQQANKVGFSDFENFYLNHSNQDYNQNYSSSAKSFLNYKKIKVELDSKLSFLNANKY